MNETSRAAASTVVVVACLCLLGFLVHERAEGAAVAAVAVVTTIVAWVSRSPERRDPPAGPGAVVLVAAGALVVALDGCAPFWGAAELVARKTQCALAHRHLPDAQILVECAVDERDAKNILSIVGQERAHDVALAKQVGCSR